MMTAIHSPPAATRILEVTASQSTATKWFQVPFNRGFGKHTVSLCIGREFGIIAHRAIHSRQEGRPKP